MDIIALLKAADPGNATDKILGTITAIRIG